MTQSSKESKDRKGSFITITLSTIGVISACLLVVLFLSSVCYIFTHDANPVKSKMLQPVEEIRVNMELMGYENINYGTVVKMLGGNIGPCLTFSATYKGTALKGGYCTPRYSIDKWGPVIMDREISNVKELVDGSYRE